MKVKTEPSLPTVEQKLSVKDLDFETYKESINQIEDEGYSVSRILLKRAAVPKFNMGIPLKLLVDWDPQLDGADMLLLLKEEKDDRSGRRVRLFRGNKRES